MFLNRLNNQFTQLVGIFYNRMLIA